AETGFTLSRGPDTVRAPDIAFVRRERLPDPIPVGFPDLAPDLVVEVLSPGERAGEILAKVADWLSAGTRLVWVVDPERRLARVVAQGVGRVLDVRAHHPDEQWTRQLVFELGPQNATDIHQAAVGAPIHLLPEVADAVAEPLRGAVRQVHAQQPQIGRGPLEE